MMHSGFFNLGDLTAFANFEENDTFDNYLYPLSHPKNVHFRYVLAEPDPFAAPAWNAKTGRIDYPPASCLYRPVVAERVVLALHDSASQLQIELDRLTVTGFKGYSTARATHSVSHGRWYFEVKILDMPESSAVRIGWGQHYSNVQAPVGFDRHGYCWRSLKGTRFHNGYGKTYGQGYGTGDVLGFFIELPRSKDDEYVTESYKNRCLIKHCGHFYYEISLNSKGEENSASRISGSTIEFFKNGLSEGVAFTEIFKGAYYPCVSFYKSSKVKVNFGPNFEYGYILDDYEAKPYSDCALDNAVEVYFANLLDLIVISEQISSLQIIDLQ